MCLNIDVYTSDKMLDYCSCKVSEIFLYLFFSIFMIIVIWLFKKYKVFSQVRRSLQPLHDMIHVFISMT